MARTETRDHSGLIEHHGTPHGSQEPVDPPRPARCTARAYGGRIVSVDGLVTFRAHAGVGHAGPLLAFTAEFDGWGAWTAWVRADCCEPLPVDTR